MNIRLIIEFLRKKRVLAFYNRDYQYEDALGLVIRMLEKEIKIEDQTKRKKVYPKA